MQSKFLFLFLFISLALHFPTSSYPPPRQPPCSQLCQCIVSFGKGSAVSSMMRYCTIILQPSLFANFLLLLSFGFHFLCLSQSRIMQYIAATLIIIHNAVSALCYAKAVQSAKMRGRGIFLGAVCSKVGYPKGPDCQNKT